MRTKESIEKGKATKKRNRLKKKELEDIEFNTKIKSIRIYCGKLKKTVVIPWENCRIDALESPCDLCGSHGHKSIEVRCKCGMEHEIEVQSW